MGNLAVGSMRDWLGPSTAAPPASTGTSDFSGAPVVPPSAPAAATAAPPTSAAAKEPALFEEVDAPGPMRAGLRNQSIPVRIRQYDSDMDYADEIYTVSPTSNAVQRRGAPRKPRRRKKRGKRP